MSLISVLFVILVLVAVYSLPSPYAPDWGVGNRMGQPTCVDIPENLTLCHGIGYTKMRLPNLLDHETMVEVSQQAVSWVPLFNLKCHPDTQLFLCSLFSPVCLDRPIHPCRSLCEAVRQGCESRMRVYGFPWPDMVRCDKFPLDNDMCISVQSNSNTEIASCTACNQPETYENIIDNYCRADFVIKTKIRKFQKTRLSCKRARILKVREGVAKRDLRRPTFNHANMTCCGDLVRMAGRKSRLLIMGMKKGGEGLVPTFIMEWKRSDEFKGAVRMMKRINCTNPQIISEDTYSGSRKRRTQRSKKEKNKPLRRASVVVTGGSHFVKLE